MKKFYNPGAWSQDKVSKHGQEMLQCCKEETSNNDTQRQQENKVKQPAQSWLFLIGR